jgi:hypothetical protein
VGQKPRIPPEVVCDDVWARGALPRSFAMLAPYELALRTPTLIEVHDSETSFAEASGRSEPWLRAYTRFDRIDVLRRPRREEVERETVQLFAHELCHAALVQRFDGAAQVRAARFPPWFAEGTCSVIAEQQAMRMPLALVRARAPADPLAPEQIVDDHHVAYAAAHFAMAFAFERFGKQLAVRVVDRAKRGGTIEAAFTAETGLDRGSLWAAVVAADGAAYEPAAEAP